MSKPGWWIYLRDIALFLAGLVIIANQTGIYFEPPKNGPEIELIILAGLFCNGPLMLQALSVRFGTGTRPHAPAPSDSVPPSAPASEPSSGGK